MQQPEIKFINKVIRLRKNCEKQGANKLPGVMAHVNWLHRHIRHNKYSEPEQASGFLKREALRIAFIIPSQNKKMFEELNSLIGY